MVAKRHDSMTVEDFLALDREKLDQKYEFRNGHMVAMAGGSTNHTLLIGNRQGLLHAHLRKNPCSSLVEGTLSELGYYDHPEDDKKRYRRFRPVSVDR